MFEVIAPSYLFPESLSVLPLAVFIALVNSGRPWEVEPLVLVKKSLFFHLHVTKPPL